MGIETALIAGAVASGGAAILDSKSQRDSVKSAERQKAASQAYIDKAIKDARSDIFKLYPAAQQSRQQGLQSGLDLFRQAYPAMTQAFQGGNVAAQNQLLAGLPQMNNAILGRPVNLGGLQSIALQQPNFQIPQAPQFQSVDSLGLGGNAATAGG